MKRLLLALLVCGAVSCASDRSVLLEGTNTFEHALSKYIEQCAPPGAPPEFSAPDECDDYGRELAQAQKDLLALTDAMLLGGPAPLQREAVEKSTKRLRKRA